METEKNSWRNRFICIFQYFFKRIHSWDIVWIVMSITVTVDTISLEFDLQYINNARIDKQTSLSNQFERKKNGVRKV